MAAPGPMMPGHHPALGVSRTDGPGGVGVTGEGVQDEHSVAGGGVELAPGLIGHVDRAQSTAHFEDEPFGTDHSGEAPIPYVVADLPGSRRADSLN